MENKKLQGVARDHERPDSKDITAASSATARRVGMETPEESAKTDDDKLKEYYEGVVREKSEEVFDAMAPRISSEDMTRLRAAFEFAKEAHAPQKRKSGEPYITHPIAVAKIAAIELQLDVNSVIAAFLHDVVEDTPHTVAEIRRLFGNDVAFLVHAVTKEKKKKYVMSKQLDNFKQMLDAMRRDIRAILVKLADRLHNMRTLASMPPGEADEDCRRDRLFLRPAGHAPGPL